MPGLRWSGSLVCDTKDVEHQALTTSPGIFLIGNQGLTDFWRNYLYPLGIYCCYWWSFILNTPFFSLWVLDKSSCSFAGFFSFSKHTYLLKWSASLLGLQAREWQMSHAAVLLPTSHCHGTGSSADKTPVQWSYGVWTFCPGLTEITHFDFYCLECFVLSIHMISLTFGPSSRAYIHIPIHTSFVVMIISLLKFLCLLWFH